MQRTEWTLRGVFSILALVSASMVIVQSGLAATYNEAADDGFGKDDFDAAARWAIIAAVLAGGAAIALATGAWTLGRLPHVAVAGMALYGTWRMASWMRRVALQDVFDGSEGIARAVFMIASGGLMALASVLWLIPHARRWGSSACTALTGIAVFTAATLLAARDSDGSAVFAVSQMLEATVWLGIAGWLLTHRRPAAHIFQAATLLVLAAMWAVGATGILIEDRPAKLIELGGHAQTLGVGLFGMVFVQFIGAAMALAGCIWVALQTRAAGRADNEAPQAS